MTKPYDFEFISNYQGASDYRLFIDGKPDTRITAHADRRCTYSDGSPLLKAELAAFNEFRRVEHGKALEKHGAEFVPPFVEYF